MLFICTQLAGLVFPCLFPHYLNYFDSASNIQQDKSLTPDGNIFHTAEHLTEWNTFYSRSNCIICLMIKFGMTTQTHI